MRFTKIALLSIVAITIAAGIAGAKGKLSRPALRPESLVAPGSQLRGGDGGPEVPFPLSASLPFPWNKIEGVWQGYLNGRSMMFSFEVKNDYQGNQILSVAQLDGASGAILSQGVGLSVSDDNLVRAAMYGTYTKDGYMLFIGAYRNNNLAPGGKKSVTVLTLREFGEMTGDNDEQLVVKKLSSVPYQQ